MTERPIIFSATSVHAIQVGIKTQSRRIVTGPRCRYGEPGDRLWVKEKLYIDQGFARYEDLSLLYTLDPGHQSWIKDRRPYTWLPAIFMPRWASRLTLDVTGLRQERLQKITSHDAIDEGFGDWMPRACFAEEWNRLNGRRGYSWATNPLVWVVTFEVVREERG